MTSQEETGIPPWVSLPGLSVVPAILVLEDGSVFQGQSVGVLGETVGELVFNTSMTGYQEILSDPSYCRQIVTLTYPHIGNTGTNSQDMESSAVQASGLVIKDLPQRASNWRNELSLSDFLKQQNVVAISGIDTRKLTRILRTKGVQNAVIMAGESCSAEAAKALLKTFPGLNGLDLASHVSTEHAFIWNQGVWVPPTLSEDLPVVEKDAKKRFHVVAYDFGVKRNILNLLVDRGCHVTVVPAKTPATEVLEYKPDGIFLSNGPGDPQPCDYAIRAISRFMEHRIPLFGICLGYQLMALAAGASTQKMKFGHHGANHPVMSLGDNSVSITSQNHGFSVSDESLPDHIEVTHRSLFDNSLQGLTCKDSPAFGFQGHPEASPGPHDVTALFDHFIRLMEQSQLGFSSDATVA